MSVATLLTLACGEDEGSVWDVQDAGGGASESGAAEDGATSNGDDDDDDDDAADDAAGEGDEGGGDGPKLDVGTPDDGTGTGSCGCELTYIWVANSDQSTVSKIDTRTMIEEGRYITKEDEFGNPSRTSVNLAGDVAVANRHGGLTKFYANPDHCVDANGDGTIQTSSGKDDVLAWNAEECRAWYTEFPTTNQRPVAWTGGQVGPGSCDASSADVWTVTSAVMGFPGIGGIGGVIVYLVDGETGAIEETIPVDGFNGGSLGAYGGAVDKFGNLWFTSLGFGSGGQVARIDADTFEAKIYMTPQDVQPYGITVDHKGRPWVSSTLGSGGGRFDPTTETWSVVQGFFGGSGLTESPDGVYMYISAGSGVYAVDLETLDVGATWTTTQTVKGVGFDVDGYLWAVTWADPDVPGETAPAYKIDVDSMTVIDVYNGLDYPYTYSDMTGSALGNVTCPPEG